MAPDHAVRVTLNANQRRHYEVLFSGLERTLTTLEAAAKASAEQDDDRTRRDALTVAVHDLPVDFATAAQPIIDKIRDTLLELQSSLALNARPVSQRHICRALLTSEIIRIEESYAKGLRGYGEVDPSIAESLDPVLRELRGELADVVTLLKAPRLSRP